MRRTSNDRAAELMTHALFDAIERAHAAAVRSPSANKAARMRQLEAIGKAGAEITALATALQILARGPKPPDI